MIVSSAPGGIGRLHLVYRSHGGENRKGRPAYYSKLLALASVLRAVDRLDVVPEVIFFNDGRIPADRLDLMQRSGRVATMNCGSNRRSYRAALSMAAGAPWADDDLVWFAEDDYLYSPDSLRTLLVGMRALPHADYFSMYSPTDLAAGRARPNPGGEGPPGSIVAGDVRWFRAKSTTSTFGVRVRALRQDRRLLRSTPYSGGAWDHTSCLAVQGEQPFNWPDLGHELLPFRSEPVREWPRSVVRGTARVMVNLRSRRRPERRRTLYAASPLPIWHLESTPEQPIAEALEWAALAAETREWAGARQIALPEERIATRAP